MIFDWNLISRKHKTNADLIGAISPKKPFSSIMRYIVLWRHLWRYHINANIKTWYPQKPHILTFTLIPSSFFSDHCVKLYRWMCITFQMPLVHNVICVGVPKWDTLEHSCYNLMQAKRAGKKFKLNCREGSERKSFEKFCTFPPNSSKLRSDYLFSFQKRTNYLFPAFSRSEYLFPKSATPPPPSESNGRLLTSFP